MGRTRSQKPPVIPNEEISPSGIAVPGESLEALRTSEMPTHTAEVVEEGSLIVEWQEYGRVHTRAYSETDHGKHFAKLASEFAEKKKGKVFKS